MTRRWIQSIYQEPPADLERRLSRYRCAVLAGLTNVCASQRWLAEGPPRPIIIARNGWVAVLVADEDDAVHLGPAPWWEFFVESWSTSFKVELRRTAAAEGELNQ